MEGERTRRGVKGEVRSEGRGEKCIGNRKEKAEGGVGGGIKRWTSNGDKEGVVISWRQCGR